MTDSLNQGQEAAAEGFFQFLMGRDKEMGISGPGGTGKTYLMGHMIDSVLPRYFETCKLLGIKPEYESVHMTATTNKAAEVLSYATKRPTSTIHSHMNLKVAEDFSTGISRIEKTRQWRVHERQIVFIDECSMVDGNLYPIVHEGLHNSKIVWVGDHCQLAPVMEKLSPVYRNGIQFYNLTEPMRTGDPHLQALNQQLRNTVETGKFHPIQIIPGVINYLDDDQMAQHIAYDFTRQDTESRILAYTNKRVIQFNDHIRHLRQLPVEYTEGETLINNSGIKLPTGMLSVEAEVTIKQLADVSEMAWVDEGVELEIRRASLENHIGVPFPNVMLPVNRDHFYDLIAYYKRKKNWNRYYHLKNNFPDLRPKDAGTVYKAQGSTYDSVYIDLTNISTCNQPDQVARMLYVALSRPRHKIYLYGQLADKYGGLVF